MGGEIGFVEKVKGFIAKPMETFQDIKEETMNSALKYFVVWIIIYGVLFGIVYTMFYSTLFGDFLEKPEEMFGGVTGITFLVLMIIMVIVGELIGIFIGGAWLHLWVRIFGGKKGYHQTIKAMIYGNTPNYLFGWIPFISFISGIWSLILIIFGIKELHEISTGKAAAATIVAIIVLLVIVALLAATIYVWVAGFA